jgi:hypothetical protein
MSYTECRKLPVVYRHWFINRIVEDLRRKKEAMAPKGTIDENTGPSVSVLGQKRFV